MNQNQFFELLDYYFRNVDPYMYEEIKKDYQEHFKMGQENGKTEEEITNELGSPKKIYQEYQDNGIIDDRRKVDFSNIMDFASNIGSLFTKREHAQEDRELIQEEKVLENKFHRIELRINADVFIDTHEEDTIEIVYNKNYEDFTLPIKESDHALKIGSFDINHLLTKRNPVNSIYIKIPKSSDMGLNISTVSENIAVVVDDNDVNVKTVNGDIDIQTKGENVFANTAAGNIKITGGRKKVEANTISGKITVDSHEPVVYLKTTSGAVKVELDKNNKTDVKSVSGDVDIKLLEKDMKLEILTVSGEIFVENKCEQNSKTTIKSYEKSFGEAKGVCKVHTISGEIHIQ